MKRKISTIDGVSEVLQQGELRKIGDHYYFAAMYAGFQRISEMSTGYALPKCTSFKEAEEFLNKQPEGRVGQVITTAAGQNMKSGVTFPLNVRTD